MYLLPDNDRFGIYCVWLEYMVSHTLYTFVKMLRSFLPLSLLVLQISNGCALDLVDRTFWRV